MFVHWLKTLLIVALSAPPFLMALTGCAFNPPTGVGSYFHPGLTGRTSVIFCDIERGRDCASSEDIVMGVDVTQRELAFLAGKSSMFGLDYSPEAMARCGGRPERVLYQGAFPEGSAVSLNPSRIGIDKDDDGNLRYDSVDTACKAWCDEHVYGSLGPWIDSDLNRYSCANIARAAFEAGPYMDTSTDTGILRADFQDPRKPALKPLLWVNVVNLTVFGANNSVRKTAGTGTYNAGASSPTALAAGADGAFEFMVSETDAQRAAGFALGPPPDVDPTDNDILYGVELMPTRELRVIEFGQPVFTGSYDVGDHIRLAVVGGIVHYFRNGDLIHVSANPVGNAVLRVSVSIRDLNGTITDAFVSF